MGIGFLALVPLVPFAPQQIPPEWQYIAYRYDFKKELTTVIAGDLAASGIAKNVVLSTDCNITNQQAANAYHLNVQLKEGIWHRNMTCYGLSIPGFCSSFVGVPVSYGSFELALQCAMKDSKGEPVGETNLSSKIRITEGLYYNNIQTLCGKVHASYSQLSPQLRAFVAQSLDEGRDAEVPVRASRAVGVETKSIASDDNASRSASPRMPMVPVQATRKGLTNSDVVTMLKGGLPESTIIIAVKRRPALFDTSPSALIDLKNQGATAGVLDAMMQP